jgi:hypothetical protein
MLKVFTVVFVGLVLAAPATAGRNESWWNPDHAEAVLLDSDWAFDQDVMDASCKGWGGYKPGSDSERTFNRFVCTAYAERESTWCLPGECTVGFATSTCAIRVKLRATGAESFLLSGTRSSC